MTQEEKAKRYDEALERARKLQENSILKKWLWNIFPELKESEDERIRKAILELVRQSSEVLDKQNQDKMLAWLEKQSKSNLIEEIKRRKEILLHEKEKAVSFAEKLSLGGRIAILEELLVFADESQAEQKSIWHNEDEEPKRGRLILLIMQSGTPIVAKIIEPNHTFNHGERWAYIDDLLEKQGEQKPVSKVKPKFRIGDVIEVKPMKCQDKIFTGKTNKIIDITEESYILDDGKAYSIELQNGWKLSEQKSDEVEPKFKVGDWISGYYTNYKVLSLNNDGYVVEDVDGDKINILFENEKFHHLFTIADAKDGDVLSWDDSKCITIFKNIYDEESFNSYGFVGGCTGTFESRMSYHDIEGAHPATKEQRDTLIKAMVDAGYTFDFKKKKLKKIEQIRAKWSEEDELSCFESALFTAFSDAWQQYLRGKEVDIAQWVKEHSKELLEAAKEELKGHNSAWSEEDTEISSMLIELIESKEKSIEAKVEFVAWLKSLKKRMNNV